MRTHKSRWGTSLVTALLAASGALTGTFAPRLLANGSSATEPLTTNSYVQARKLTTAIPCSTNTDCDDGEAEDQFGYSVAMSADGSTLVVTTPWHRTYDTQYPNVYGHGAAYVFVRPSGPFGGWDAPFPMYYSAKLLSTDVLPYQSLAMGNSVSVSADGSTIVIGARGYPTGVGPNGAAYVFVRPATGWGSLTTHYETAKITQADAAAYYSYGSFGHAVSMSADGATIVVGAPDQKAGAPFSYNTGAAYVYFRPANGWISTSGHAQKHIGSGVNPLFGTSVSLSADASTLVVGANGVDINKGTAHLFVRRASSTGGSDLYSPAGQLIASDGAARDFFGYSVSANGDGSAIVVGAPTTGINGYDPGLEGAAYVFERPSGGWGPAGSTLTESGKLIASDRQIADSFGRAVAFSGTGNRIVAGVPQMAITSGNFVNGPGAIYVFARPATGWSNATEAAKLAPLDGATGDNVGRAVSINNDGTAIVGAAPRHKIGEFSYSQGATYVFTGSVQLPKASTTTTIASVSPNPVLVGRPQTVTVSVAAPAGSPLVPSGNATVQASTGESCVATAPSGSCNLIFATAMDRTISASYSGDANFDASSSPNASVQVIDFSLAASPTSQAINGKKATVTLSLSALNGFTGTVALTCAGGPPNAACAVSPASISLSGAATAKATVTLPNNAPAGAYTITFNAVSGGATRSATATVTVQGKGQRSGSDF
jgi:hypothetical protein